VAQILPAGLARGPIHHWSKGTGVLLRPFVMLGVALLVSFCFASAQTPSRSTAAAPKDKLAPTATAQPIPLSHFQAPARTVPEMIPTLPPVISWDGKKLTIDAANSTLADILLAIRSRTGASIDMPGVASGERVALHLGPAPIREVIASLLYGTDFDYVIQGSDDDEYGLKSVIITQRGKGDDMNAGDIPQQAGVRLMPGYAAPGKRTFEVMSDHQPADDANPVTDASASTDSAPTDQESASTATDDSSTQQAKSDSDSQNTSSSASTDSADATAPVGTAIPVLNSETSSAGASVGSGGGSMSQMEQNLQRMYQQRQKIQAQQNQGGTPSGK
jgi:predicted  nucleic acid-binding Zn-ribbon protein